MTFAERAAHREEMLAKAWHRRERSLLWLVLMQAGLIAYMAATAGRGAVLFLIVFYVPLTVGLALLHGWQQRQFERELIAIDQLFYPEDWS